MGPLGGRAAIWLRPDIDTDTLLPARFITSPGRRGHGHALFAGLQEADGGPSNLEGASVLLAGARFGCGSSREQAVWALQEAGFVAIVAPSFAPIFYRNALINRLLPAIVQESALQEIAHRVEGNPDTRLFLQVEGRQLRVGHDLIGGFTLSAAFADLLLKGEGYIRWSMRFRPEAQAFVPRLP